MTKEERRNSIRAQMTATLAGGPSLFDENILDQDSLIDEIIRIEDLYLQFKQAVIPEGLVETAPLHAFNDHQQMVVVTVLIESIKGMDALSAAMTDACVGMSIANCMLRKAVELQNLKESING